MNPWTGFLVFLGGLAALVLLVRLLVGARPLTVRPGTLLWWPLWIAVAVPVWLAAVLLRTVEQAWELLRSPRIRCPHPDCFQPVRTVGRACPGCALVHRPLYPELFEPLWQRCTCGRPVPTTALLGRNRLDAYCPHCVRRLPREVTTVRAVHIAFVGGTASGKTMLMAAMVAGLRSWGVQWGLRIRPATPVDENRLLALQQQLAPGGSVPATTGAQPRAVMLLLERGRQRRLLYLYDPMGAALEDAAAVREQRYLAHVDGVVLVADVLADPGVRAALDRSDASRAVAARPALQGPVQTYEQLTGELAGLSGGRQRVAVAVVVTKRDMLEQLASLPVPGGPTREWLAGVGLDGLVRGIGHDFGTARYWTVSARAAGGTAPAGARAGPSEPEQRHAAGPLLWLLSRSGLDTRDMTNQQNAYWAKGTL
ncbi:TRAFAC clade GTPase domain-containing protein [Streptacidiphilus carbonis]|uniref:TRAFAC clade GTPase domain-containing protein n=1 Tax=Streptacidiphilus carbonis TaxID=105422 RepID=UPI000693A7B2|nr:hypothetical protein [Streptacidiphilus carbonis]